MSLRTPWFLAVLLMLGSFAGCSSDDTPTCTSPQIACSGACVNLLTDSRNCGGCGSICPADQTCVAARCQPVCPNGQNRCGETCVDLQNDQTNCGMCGNRCSPGRVCTAGVCEVECGPGLSVCEGAVGDAGKSIYCANFQLDRQNCGGCGNVCPAGQLCREGLCVVSCPAGQAACGDRCVDLSNDNLNCGSCRAACATSFTCQMSRCRLGACPPNTTLCSGRCVDINNDRSNCGACSAPCPSGNVCSNRMCQVGCATGQTLCTDTCSDLMTDSRNCGMCGRTCMAGTVCQAGACTTVCQMGQTLCDGRCVDTMSDRANCGMCGQACPGSQVCTSGTCAAVCGMGQTLCNGTTCVNAMTDRENCGMCGRACPANNACVAGACVPFAPTPDGSVCAAPSMMCGASCTDVRSDNNHCGRCGSPCTADRVCFNGMCLATCALGESRCPTGACVNLSNNAMNCGACGTVCPTATPICFRGRCSATPPPTRYVATNMPPAELVFIDACAQPGARRILDGMDDANETVPIPFAFRYFSNDLPEGYLANITTNGYLNLDGMATSLSGVFITSTTTPNGIVAVHAGNLATTAPICVATVGSAPNRKWVVEWSGAAERTGSPLMNTGNLVFEVIVSEGTDLIDMIFQRMDSATSRYTGLESIPGTVGVGGCPSGTTLTTFCTPAVGVRIRYTPAP